MYIYIYILKCSCGRELVFTTMHTASCLCWRAGLFTASYSTKGFSYEDPPGVDSLAGSPCFGSL